MAYLGIDIGGTKTLIAVFNGDGEIVVKLKFLTNKKYPIFLEDIKKNLAKMNVGEIKSCAVSIPGLINRKNGVAVALGNLEWKNAPIKHDLEQITGCNVGLEHDASLGGLYEARNLKKKYHKVLYITISTGIGIGLIIDNKIDIDFANSEAGQMMIEHKGKLRKWESFASGSAIVKQYGMFAKDISDDHTWSIITQNIAVGVLDLMAIVQPDVIIFSGGVGNYFEKFELPLKNELSKYSNPLIKQPILVKASRADDSVIYGCFEMIKDLNE